MATSLDQKDMHAQSYSHDDDDDDDDDEFENFENGATETIPLPCFPIHQRLHNIH
jgi:hypothetical protein